MNNKIKKILAKLEKCGYEAYVVGGFVRDYLLGIASYDVDISTSCEPKKIKEIFDLNNSNDDNYGSISLKDSLYNYDITTFRKEYDYENRHPKRVDFVLDIEEDIKRRDFTINSLFMDSKGEIYDLVSGLDDLENKIIRVNGNINDKMVEDPLRILRAIRFSSVLDFQIEETFYNYIRQNKQLIKTLSYTRKKEELDVIFNNQNKMQGIKLIKELNLEDVLEINIPDDIKDVSNSLGIWAQIEASPNYQFTNNDLNMIESTKRVLNYGIIDEIVLYECGLYVCIIAGEILGITKQYISNLYKNLPIYSSKDIALNGNDIMDILGIEPGEKIKDIINDLEINILNNGLSNDYDSLKNYINKYWR